MMWLLFALIMSASYAGLVRQLLIRQDHNWIHSFKELLNTNLPIYAYFAHVTYLERLGQLGQKLQSKVTSIALEQIPEYMLKTAINKAVLLGDDYFFEQHFELMNSDNLNYKVSEKKKLFTLNSMYPVNKHSVYGKRIEKM